VGDGDRVTLNDTFIFPLRRSAPLRASYACPDVAVPPGSICDYVLKVCSLMAAGGGGREIALEHRGP